MRKLRAMDVHGVTVEEVLEEFNERRGEFGVADSDIVSVSARTPAEPHNIAMGGKTRKSEVVVTIFHWSDK